jgi:hypothetical protein
MLKQLTLAAFVVTAGSAFGQDMMDQDPSTLNSSDLQKYVMADVWKKASAPDAYVISRFIAQMPGNRANAVLRGLAQNAYQARTLTMERQTAANAQGPAGMSSSSTENTNWSTSGEESARPFRTYASMPGELSYDNTVKILSSGLGTFDEGLIVDLFAMRSFTQSFIPTVMHERELDAISRYFKANAKWSEPARLKYTSLAPRAPYVSPTIPR